MTLTNYSEDVITVETTDTGVRVNIPAQDLPPDRLNAFLDWLRLEAIARQSRLTEEDAMRLTEDVKSDWWLANKHRFFPEGDALGLRNRRH
jgi:hypothetical protein